MNGIYALYNKKQFALTIRPQDGVEEFRWGEDSGSTDFASLQQAGFFVARN